MKNKRFSQTLKRRQKAALRFQKSSKRHIKREWGRHIWRTLYRADLAEWKGDYGYYERRSHEAKEEADREYALDLKDGYMESDWDDIFRTWGGYDLQEHLTKKTRS